MALCAGYGGIELGMRIVDHDFRCVCYVEREAYCAGLLAARMADGSMVPAPIWDDLSFFPAYGWRGVVDIILAGFPCQPFSTAGKHGGEGDERWLWPYVATVVGNVRPAVVFLENSEELVRGGLGLVQRDLARLGYDSEWSVLGAEAVGAPHGRTRCWTLAYSGGVGLSLLGEAYDGYWRDAQGHEPDRRGARVGHHDEQCDGGCDCYCGESMRLADAPFPPLPDDASAWRDLCEVAPGQTPWEDPAELRGVADGASVWVDRTRAIGNGVVPAVAAAAFIELARRAIGR